MAEESFQERTEAPTPKRRREARERGQVPRSQEVGTALLLLAAAAVIHLGGGSLARALSRVFTESALSASAPPIGIEGTVGMLRGVGWQVIAALAPIVLGVSGLATTAAAIQAQGVLSWEPMKPDWGRISPKRNLGRIFGVRSIAELLKAVLKLVLVGVVVYFALRRVWPEILASSQKTPIALLLLLRHTAVRLFGMAGVPSLWVALGDYLCRLWRHDTQRTVGLQEGQEEGEDDGGDPSIKC